MSKWVTFDDVSGLYPNTQKKTKTFNIWTKTTNPGALILLGKIKWFGNWRQYCFYPEGSTIWNRECMRDVEDFMQQLMEDRKKNA